MPDLGRWRTAVTEVADSQIRYRGRDIADAIGDGDLAATLWQVLFGGEASPGQADAVRRSLVAALDHGVTAPSTLVARATASTRGPVPYAIAAGMVAFAGPAHGGAAEGAARLFASVALGDRSRLRDAVRGLLEAGERVPGYGHPYHTNDPRVRPLLEGTAPSRVYRDMAMDCEQVVHELTGRAFAMNADAAVAALLLDAGLLPADVTLITCLGRAFGLAAHAREEQLSEKPFRAPALATVIYSPEPMKGVES